MGKYVRNNRGGCSRGGAVAAAVLVAMALAVGPVASSDEGQIAITRSGIVPDVLTARTDERVT
jgi:hypothetical protein